MARYIGFHDSRRWNKVAEVKGRIQVYAGGTHPGWFDISQVDVYYGTAWITVWKLPAAETAHVVKPPTHVTTYHTATVRASVFHDIASWRIPSGRHVTRQTVIYGSPIGGTGTMTVSASVRTTHLPHGATHATVRYTYY